MLVFSPKDPKYTITVFTDIDCGYCRKLHSQMAEYNRLGIRVRYLFYPRSGPDTESWHKAEAVWCSANRNDALTRAKKGEEIKAPEVLPATSSRATTSSGRSSMVAARRPSSWQTVKCCPATLPPAQLAQYLKTGSR